MIAPVTAPDVRLLLSLLDYAICEPDQRERVSAWLQAKMHGMVAPEGYEPNPDGLDPGREALGVTHGYGA